MTTPTFLKLLDEALASLNHKRNRALAKGGWVTAIECDAKEELCRELRAKVMEPCDRVGGCLKEILNNPDAPCKCDPQGLPQ